MHFYSRHNLLKIKRKLQDTLCLALSCLGTVLIDLKRLPDQGLMLKQMCLITGPCHDNKGREVYLKKKSDCDEVMKPLEICALCIPHHQTLKRE